MLTFEIQDYLQIMETPLNYQVIKKAWLQEQLKHHWIEKQN